MSFAKKVLIYTNPLVLPVGVGVLTAIVLKNLFGGVAKDCMTVAKRFDSE